MILILWAGAANHGLEKVGAGNFQRGCCQKINIRKEPLGRGSVRPACQSIGNGWQRQGSCRVLKGHYFSPARRNSGSPTFTRRHLPQSILHTPPGSKATVVRSDQPCQGHQKQPPAIVGRSGSAGQRPCLGLWACRRWGFVQKEDVPKGSPTAPLHQPWGTTGLSVNIHAGLECLISNREGIKVFGSVTALH